MLWKTNLRVQSAILECSKTSHLLPFCATISDHNKD